MVLQQSVKAAARSFFLTGDGQEFLRYLRAIRPVIGDFSDFKSDRQFDISVGEVKGWESCVQIIDNLFEQDSVSDPLAVTNMTLTDRKKDEGE